MTGGGGSGRGNLGLLKVERRRSGDLRWYGGGFGGLKVKRGEIRGSDGGTGGVGGGVGGLQVYGKTGEFWGS